MSMGSSVPSYAEKMEYGDFKINESGFWDSASNLWEQTRIQESVDTEKEEMAITAKLSQDKLRKENPDNQMAIDKYGVYDEDASEAGGMKAIKNLYDIKGRLERQRFKRYFNDGQIYVDKDGFIKTDVDSLKDVVNQDQDNLKLYWEYRQLTDGTEYDMATLDARNVARMQNELVKLMDEQRGASGFLAKAGEMAGTMAFITTEPEILSTMFSGGANVGGGIAKNAFQGFAKEVGMSAVSDSMMKFQVDAWRRKLYDPARGIEAYTTMDAIKDISIDALFAGTLQGVGSAVMDVGAIARYTSKSKKSSMSLKYKAGKKKFAIMDAYKGVKEQFGDVSFSTRRDIYRWGGEDWRQQLRNGVDDSIAKRSESGKADADEVVEDVVDIASSSPRGDIGAHVEDLSRAQEHIEAGTRFPDDNIHADRKDAMTGDYILVKDSDGTTVLARVEDGDAEDLVFADVDGNPIIMNRATGEVDSDRWSASDEVSTIDMGGKIEDVNQVSVDDIIKRDTAETKLIDAHKEDEEIMRYNKGEETTLQRLVDGGCLTMSDLKG